jgi:hypothetical protein
MAITVFALIVWCARKWLWAKRELVADYVVALCTVLAGCYFTLGGRMNLAMSVVCAGWGLALSTGLRTVRLSGLLPRKHIVELLWALPATLLLATMPKLSGRLWPTQTLRHRPSSNRRIKKAEPISPASQSTKLTASETASRVLAVRANRVIA